MAHILCSNGENPDEYEVTGGICSHFTQTEQDAASLSVQPVLIFHLNIVG